MNLRFSIIAPVYNVAPYLRECLDSVVAQTFSNWECVCVDDGSTDGSGAILDEYSAKDSRFKVLHKKNGGVSSARNVGLDAATGDWIAFLDADDVWAPWTLDYVAHAIDANGDIDLVRFGTVIFPENGHAPWGDMTEVPFSSEVEDVSKAISVGAATCFFAGKIYRRDVVDGMRFENYTVGEDLLFLARCIVKAKKQVCIKTCCYGYRQRRESASHTGSIERIQRDRLGYIPAILQEFESSDKIVDKVLWRSYANKLTEQFFVSLVSVKGKARNEIYNEWLRVLRNIGQLKKISRFQRVRVWILSRVQFIAVAYIMCFIPYIMKAKVGIRRWELI